MAGTQRPKHARPNVAAALLLLLTIMSTMTCCAAGRGDDGDGGDDRLLAQLLPDGRRARVAAADVRDERDDAPLKPAYERVNGVWLRTADTRPLPALLQQQLPPSQQQQPTQQQQQPQPPPSQQPSQQQAPKPPQAAALRASLQGVAEPATARPAQQQPHQAAGLPGPLGLAAGMQQQLLLRERPQQSAAPSGSGPLVGAVLTGRLAWSGARPAVNAFNASSPDIDFLIPPGVSNRAAPAVAVDDAAVEFGSMSALTTAVALITADVHSNGSILLSAAVVVPAPSTEASQGLRLTLAGPALAAFTGVRVLSSGFGAGVVTASLANATVSVNVARVNTTAPGALFQALLQLSQCEPGSGPCCGADYQFKASTTLCRAAAHSCEVDTYCTGRGAACDSQLAPDGAVCSWPMPVADPAPAAPAFAGGVPPSDGRRSVRRFSTPNSLQLGRGWPSRNEAGPAQLRRREADAEGSSSEGGAPRVAAAGADVAGLTMCRGTCARGRCRIQLDADGSCWASQDDAPGARQRADRQAMGGPSPWGPPRQRW